MKKISLLERIGVELISEDKFSSGTRVLKELAGTISGSESGDWTADLLSEGLETKAQEELYLCLNEQRAPGTLAYRPNGHDPRGLNPASLSVPFQLCYTYEDPETNEKAWVGQDNFGVKTYYDFKFSDIGYDQELYIANPFMFEHSNDLYMLVERVETIFGSKRNQATLYQLQEDLTWKTKHKFADAIDVFPYDETTPGSRAIQSGSPCGVSFNGELYVAYRVVDRNSGETNITTLKMVGDDFEKICVTRIEDAPGPDGSYSKYRLRMAAGGGQIMMVSYGIYTNTTDIRDFRTFISFDEGYSFNTNSRSYRSVLRGESEKYENTPSYFFVREGLVSSDGIINCDVKFSLHFDETIMSFVLFKGGDYSGLGEEDLQGSNTLIGLVSNVSNPFMWDQAVRYTMTKENAGIGSNVQYNTSLDIRSFDPLIGDSENSLLIDDIVAISNGKEHFLFISGKGPYSSNTALTKFRLVATNTLPKGFLQRLISLGQKIHKDLIFLTDPIDPHSSGFVHEGSGSNVLVDEGNDNYALVWKNLVGSFWRNQLAFSAQMTESDYSQDSVIRSRHILAYDRFVTLAIAGRITTLGEQNGYALSYPARLRDPRLVFEQVLNNGSAVYDEAKNLWIITTPASPEDYLTPNSANSSPSITQRARLARIPLFKTRFQVETDNLGSGEVEVFDWTVFSAVTDDVSVVSVSCHIRYDGAVRFRNQNGTISPIAAFITLGTKYDFSIVTERFGDNRLLFSYKESGSDNWISSLVDLDFTEYYSGPANSGVSYGIVSGAGLPSDVYVGIGDVHLSNYNSGYYPSLGSAKNVNALYRSAEQICSKENFSLPKTRMIHQYSPILVTKDGSEIEIRDHVERAVTFKRFEMQNSRNENHIDNLKIRNTTTPYNFTSVVEGELETLLYRNTDLCRFDSVALVFGIGITSVSLISGYYDEFIGLWGSTTTESFDWPKTQLTIVDAFDDILAISEVYQPHELRGRYIWTYSNDTGEYEEQIKIVDNDLEMIVLETAPNMAGDMLVYLPEVNAVFSFDKRNPHSHVGLELTAPLSGIKSIANVEFGSLKTMEDALSEVEFSLVSSDDLIVTDRGYSFNSKTDSSSIVKEMTLSLPNLRLNSSYFNRVSSGLKRLKDNNESFILLEESDDERIANYGSIKALAFKPEGTEVSIDFTYCASTYKDESVNYEESDTATEIVFSEAEIVLDRAFTVSCSITTPGVTYEWFFNNISVATSSSYTHVPVSLGELEIRLEVTDPYGVVATKEVLVIVREAGITEYTVAASPLSPHTVTFTGVNDIASSVDESSMRLYIQRIEPTPAAISSDTVRLTAGVGTTIITSTAGLTKIYFVDSEGKNWLKEVFLA